jgi:hypothetical protein
LRIVKFVSSLLLGLLGAGLLFWGKVYPGLRKLAAGVVEPKKLPEVIVIEILLPEVLFGEVATLCFPEVEVVAAPGSEDSFVMAVRALILSFNPASGVGELPVTL